MNTPQTEKPLVFISYARQDEELMEELRPHLTVSATFDVWVDQELRGGDLWESKITSILEHCDLAIFFISKHFFNSKFIRDVEIPHILERQKRQEITVYPIIATPVSWKGIPWLTTFNVRPRSGKPVWEEGGRFAEQRLAQIAEEVGQMLDEVVKERAAKSGAKSAVAVEENQAPIETKPEPTPLAASPPPLRPGTELRVFDLHMPSLDLFACDTEGSLWCADSEQVKVFRISKETFLHRLLLPNLRWKHSLPSVWNRGVVYADWDGSLHHVTPPTQGGDQLLYEAKPDDLPIHRLAAGPDGYLAAATWNGLIRRWDAAGHRVGTAEIKLPFLPIHLLPLQGGGLAVADQANFLRVYNSAGQETWQWHNNQPLHAVWGWEERGQPVFLAQSGQARLLKICPGRPRPEVIDFEEPIVCLSPRPGPAPDWVVIAREGKADGARVDWLSTSPFRVVRDSRLDVPFTIRELRAVQDPSQASCLLATGLAADGRLFTIQESTFAIHPVADKIHRLALDGSGGFLFLLCRDKVHVIRNPAFPKRAPCQAALDQVVGALLVNAFTKIQVWLKNVGATAILDVKAELAAEGLIDPCQASKRVFVPAGQSLDLEFAVRCRVTGSDVPLKLRLELCDEGGPPATVQEIHFHIASR